MCVGTAISGGGGGSAVGIQDLPVVGNKSSHSARGAERRRIQS